MADRGDADLRGSRSRLPLLLGDDWHDAAAVIPRRVLQPDEGVDGVAEEGRVGHATQEPNLQESITQCLSAERFMGELLLSPLGDMSVRLEHHAHGRRR